MEISRAYGKEPIRVVLLHGGPGATGSMAPVAKNLSATHGILEILNYGTSIEEQIFEIYEEILRYCDLPVILAGHSWGAWLGWIFTAKFPNLISKLILISSGPFESKFATQIQAARLNRLDEEEKTELKKLMQQLSETNPADANEIFKTVGRLMLKSDQYKPVIYSDDDEFYSYEVYRKVWPEAEHLRKSGELLAMAQQITVPVVALHGNYDPHHFQGVFEPLRKKLSDFKMHIIDKCGHYPWMELEARDDFYGKLFKALQ